MMLFRNNIAMNRRSQTPLQNRLTNRYQASFYLIAWRARYRPGFGRRDLQPARFIKEPRAAFKFNKNGGRR